MANFIFSALEKYEYKPYRNLHFNGNIYIVQGGYTFSAAAMFVLNIKGQQNVTVVGEETGGGDYGTTTFIYPILFCQTVNFRLYCRYTVWFLDGKQELKMEKAFNPIFIFLLHLLI